MSSSQGPEPRQPDFEEVAGTQFSSICSLFKHSTTAEETIRAAHTDTGTHRNGKSFPKPFTAFCYLPISLCYFYHCCFDLFLCEKAEVIKPSRKEKVGNGDTGVHCVEIGNR